MSDDGNVLPQAEIDAIFKQATGRNLVAPAVPEQQKSASISSAPSSKGSPKVKAVSSENTTTQSSTSVKRDFSESPDTEKLSKIMATLDKLTRRIEKIEENIIALGQSQPSTPDNSEFEKRILQKVKNEEIDLHKTNQRMNSILTRLKETPGYGVRRNYTCSNCGSHGFMAIPMKCSSCGTQGWLGWWPEK